MLTEHRSVLSDELLHILALERPQPLTIIDTTVGPGGHAALVAERLRADSWLIALDRDPAAVAMATERLRGVEPRVTVRRARFSQLRDTARELGVTGADAIYSDVGFNSDQTMDPERGFSFDSEFPPDMRYEPDSAVPSAYDLLMTASEEQLEEIFLKYGEERHARPVARAVVRARSKDLLKSCRDFTALVAAVLPKKAYRLNPATKCYMGLRVYVNHELEELQRLLPQAFDLLKVEGRLAVITFNSLEHHLVRQQMQEWCHPCHCPPELPMCVCGKQPRAELLTHKAVRPSPAEVYGNVRSRSAQLRAVRKLLN